MQGRRDLKANLILATKIESPPLVAQEFDAEESLDRLVGFHECLNHH
jgi:hypothetical protein